MLLPHLPAPAADAPCFADARWNDVKVLAHQLLLLLLLQLTQLRVTMKGMRRRRATATLLLPPLPPPHPDQETSTTTAARCCTAPACKVGSSPLPGACPACLSQCTSASALKLNVQAMSTPSRSYFLPAPASTPRHPVLSLMQGGIWGKKR
jgi:hypothetical protein